MARNLPRQRLAKVLPNNVAAQRQRQTRLGEPPLAKVLDEMEALVGEGEAKQAKPEPATVQEVLDQLADGTLTYEQALPKIRALRGVAAKRQ